VRRGQFRLSGKDKRRLVELAARPRRALRGIVLLMVVTAVAALIGACGAEPKSAKDQTLTPMPPPMPTIAPDVWDAKGTVISDDPVNVIPEVAAQMGDGRRAVYRSVSGITGAATEVTGTFYVPKGDAPPQGWPVVALAHGTTGLTTDCALSAEPDLRGFAGAVATLLASGVAVAATDYEGLGGPGLHPYLEPRTAAFNVIDSVRALRALFPNTSTKWLAFGSSQGGQAAWAANEMNAFYGGGLELVGSLALAPAANITRIADLAYRESLTPAQLRAMPLVLTGVERATGLPTDKLMRGPTARARDALIGCESDASELRGTTISPADVKPASASDEDALAAALRKMALPMQPLSAPMLVLTGSLDELIPATWVTESVTRSCALGSQIEFREVPGIGHGEIAPDAGAQTWVVDRFENKPAPSNCSDMT
jgi:dienelactone hydrolase